MTIALSTEKTTFAHRINIEHTLHRYMPDASYDSLLDFSRGLIYMTQVGGTALLWTRSTNGHRLQRRAAWLMTYLLMLSTFNFYVYFINNFLGTEMRPPGTSTYGGCGSSSTSSWPSLWSGSPARCCLQRLAPSATTCYVPPYSFRSASLSHNKRT